MRKAMRWESMGKARSRPGQRFPYREGALSELREENKEKYGRIDWELLAGEVRGGGWIILEGKGSTEFGIGAALAEVVRAVWEDKGTILPVSTLLNGGIRAARCLCFGSRCSGKKRCEGSSGAEADGGREGKIRGILKDYEGKL